MNIDYIVPEVAAKQIYFDRMVHKCEAFDRHLRDNRRAADIKVNSIKKRANNEFDQVFQKALRETV